MKSDLFYSLIAVESLFIFRKNHGENMERINFDVNQFLESVSFALDFVEQDILGASVNHSRRVAYISLRIAEKLNLTEAEKSDITAYSIMHDNGLSEESLVTDKNFEKMERLKRIETFKAHCSIGENNIKHYPFLSKHKNIIKYHHENYDGSGFYNLKKEQIPILAQIISLADFIDNVYHFEKKDSKKTIIEYIKKHKQKRYSTNLADSFLEISSHTKFWLDLRNESISYAIGEYIVPNNQHLTWKEILDITKVFSAIVDSKSKFTARHTSGLMEKAALAADYYKFSQENKIKFIIAASLHDLGKLAISRSILEKNDKLNSREIEIMRTHTYYTKFALKRVEHFKDIKEWAANHHERLNGKGYPEGLEASELDFNSRLMACLDIYQALTEDRPYRDGLPLKKVLNIMNKMAEHKAIDKDIFREIVPYLDKKSTNK